MLRLAIAFAVFAVTCVAPSVSGARAYALLIAAGQYDDPRIRSLAAPRNDAAGVFAALRIRGVEAAAIRILTDGPPSVAELNTPEYRAAIKGRATLANIGVGLADLAKAAKPGDEVVIFYSGHGLQVADAGEPRGGRESDGKDEAIAPVDVKPVTGGFTGTLLDDELGAAVEKIRAAGAFVWVLFDSCHAGTALRGGEAALPSDTAQSKRIDGPTVVKAKTFLDVKSSDRGIAALYAVQPDETAYEDWFPASGPGRARWSAMTYLVLPFLRSGQPVTFRTLAASARAGYSWRMPRSPMIEGEIDRPFLGASAARSDFVARVSANVWRLDAGQLDGIAPGWRLRLYDAKAPSVSLGDARVTAASATTSTLALAGPPPQAGTVAIARVLEKTAPLALTIQTDPDSRLSALWAALKAAPDPLLKFPATGPYNLSLKVRANRLYFEDASDISADQRAHAASLPVSLLTGPNGAATLKMALKKFGAAHNLATLISTYEIPRTAAPLDISFARAPGPGTSAPCPDTPPSAWKATIDAAWSRALLIPDDGRRVTVKQCDMMLVRVRNRTAKPVDLTALYIDTSAVIDPLVTDPTQPSARGVRVGPNQTLTFGYYEDMSPEADGLAGVAGVKQISLIMASAASAKELPTTFDYLAQDRFDAIAAAPPSAPPTLRDDVGLAAFDRAARASMAVSGANEFRGPPPAPAVPDGDARMVTLRYWSVGP